MIIKTGLATYVPDRATFHEVVKILSNPEIQKNLVNTGNYIDINEIIRCWEDTAPEIDEAEASPVLDDEPEDPEITIERLNARVLELEAEIEERRRSTAAVFEALRPLAATAEVLADSGQAEDVQNQAQAQESRPAKGLGSDTCYAQAQYQAAKYLGMAK